MLAFYPLKMARKNNPLNELFAWIVLFSLSFFLSQIIEEQITQSEHFPFKNIIQFFVPGPEDSILELMQFMLYWILAVITRLRLWKYWK
jgi:hypothetical protein